MLNNAVGDDENDEGSDESESDKGFCVDWMIDLYLVLVWLDMEEVDCWNCVDMLVLCWVVSECQKDEMLGKSVRKSSSVDMV